MLVNKKKRNETFLPVQIKVGHKDETSKTSNVSKTKYSELSVHIYYSFYFLVLYFIFFLEP